MAAKITSEQHDWIANFCGIDARSDTSMTDEAASAALGESGNVTTIPEVTIVGDPSQAEPSDADDDPNSDEPGNLAMASRKPDHRPFPAEDPDEGEGRNRDGTVRRKAGDHGLKRGGETKRAQDKIVSDVAKELGLTPDEADKLHDEIGGRNLGPDTIREIAEGIVKDRKQKPASDPEPQPESAPAPQQAPAPSNTGTDSPPPSSDDHSTLKKVAAVVAMLGLSIVLIPTIVAAVLDPEPATKLGLAGLTAVEIAAFAAAFGFVFSSPATGSDGPQA